MIGFVTRLGKRNLVFCSILVAYCLFFFKDIIFGGHLLFGSDFFAFYLGLKQFLINQIQEHHSIPYWNPYIFGGIPFWGHFESTIFYPLDFLFWIVSPEVAYGYTMVIHIILAGLFIYMFAKACNIKTEGRLVAGSVFMCNGFIMATLFDGQMFRVQSYPWLPLIFCLLMRALKSEKPFFNVSLAGLIWGIQILSGSPQDAFYTFLAGALFIVFYFKKKDSAAFPDIKQKFSLICLFFLIGSGVAAVQLIPAFEFVKESVRSSLDSYHLLTLGSYPPEGIITAAMPHFFGNYTKCKFWVSGVPWSVPPYNLYVGILPIILLFFIPYKRSWRERIVPFALTLSIFALVLALGSHTPIFKIVYHLPGFDRIRAPAKIILLWVFAMSILAGKGMDHLIDRRGKSFHLPVGALMCLLTLFILLDLLFCHDRSIILKVFSLFIPPDAIPGKMIDASNIMYAEFHRFVLFGALSILLILLWLRGLINRTLTTLFLCGLLLFDLGYVNWGAVRHADKIYRLAKSTKKNLDKSLGKDKSIFRIGSDDLGMGPNSAMYMGYQTVSGYNPLFLHRYYEYVNQYKHYKKTVPEGWIVFSYGAYENRILMDLLNVKYEISHKERRYSLRKTYLPRAFIVPGAKIMRKEEILDYLIRPEFDPTLMVLLEIDDFQSEFTKHPPSTANIRSHVKTITYSPDQIVLETESGGPGYLFLSEIYYPGWKAFVDGRPARILRGNYIFRVIELPEGHHVVRFVFAPLSIRMGIGITLLTSFILLIFFTYALSKPKSIPCRRFKEKTSENE